MRQQERTALQSLTSSSLVVGTLTTLIAALTVFLAYNANNGLPFVPVYRVSVEVPDAARLRPGNQVRIGGFRVGAVESVKTVRHGRTVNARLNLKLDKSASPLPEDSVFRIRYLTLFGLKYLEVTRGHAKPAPEAFVFNQPKNFLPQVEFDAITSIFDQRTGEAARVLTRNLGTALAARGDALNQVVASLDPIISGLRPVLRRLAAHPEEVRRLVVSTAALTAILAPVADQLADLLSSGARVMVALDSDPQALRDSIAGLRPLLETSVRTLPSGRAFLADLTKLTAALRPGARDLRAALPDLTRAVDTGTPMLRKVPPLEPDSKALLHSLDELGKQPSTLISLLRTKETLAQALPAAKWIVPAQTVCNYATYFFTFGADNLSQRDNEGYTEQLRLVLAPLGPFNIDASLPGGPPLPLTLPAQEESSVATTSGKPANAIAGPLPNAAQEGLFKPFELPILQNHPYAPTGQKDADCQVGQTGYPLGRLSLPGQANSDPASLVSDLPGSRGPTTLYYLQNGQRELRDTRVPERQP